MKSGSKKLKVQRDYSEEELHQWLQGADLAKLANKLKFTRTLFPSLQPTNWNKLYRDFQKTKPISIRLPVRIIDKLKQMALQKGIGYQALVRLWLTERIS